MNKNLKIILFAAALITVSTLVLLGGMQIISRGNRAPEHYQLDAMEGVPNGNNAAPMSQAQLQEQFSQMAEVDEASNSITVISQAYLDRYWASNHEKKVIRSLSLEEVLFLIQDTIRLYRQYDQILLPGYEATVSDAETVQRFPSVQEKVYTKSDRSFAEETAEIRQILLHRMALLSSPEVFVQESDMLRYYPGGEKEKTENWLELPTAQSEIYLQTRAGTEQVFPTVEMVSAQLEAMGLPFVEEDWFALLAEDLHMTVYLDKTNYLGREDVLVLQMVAARDLLEDAAWEDLTLCADRGKPVKMGSGLYHGDIFPTLTPLSYQEFLAWQHVEPDVTGQNGTQETCVQDYALLCQAWEQRAQYKQYFPDTAGAILEIDCAALGVDLNDMRARYARGETVESVFVRRLSLTMGGVTKDYDVQIEFRGTYCTEKVSPVLELQKTADVALGHDQGVIHYTMNQLTAYQQLTLEEIRLVDPTGEAAFVEATLTPKIMLEDGFFTWGEAISWDGKMPLTLDAKTEYRLDVSLEQKAFLEDPDQYYSIYLVLEHGCGGKTYESVLRCTAMSLADPLMVYAEQEKGIDTCGGSSTGFLEDQP